MQGVGQINSRDREREATDGEGRDEKRRKGEGSKQHHSIVTVPVLLDSLHEPLAVRLLSFFVPER